ncbi:MAG: hypothetical protein KAU94_11740, partial [Verrucomicrobia bacterium]|nr:hypothetical protein [Verrucomicrobiota bacterium]
FFLNAAGSARLRDLRTASGHSDGEEVEPLVPEVVEPSYDPFVSANPIIPELPEIPEEEFEIEIEPEEIIKEPVIQEEPSTPAGTPAVDMDAVAATLYGGDSGSSLLVSKVFDEQYKDKRVAGSGTLKRVGKFTYDPVFTNCTGVKATFEICELDGAYSKIKITVEVKFPVEEYDALKSKIGMRFPITGTLIAQDSLMHNLYIGDG